MKLSEVFADSINRDCLRTACQLGVFAPAIAADIMVGANGWIGVPTLVTVGMFGSDIANKVQNALIRKFG